MTCLLEIDVSAIRANYDYLSQETSSRVSGVVKADAYGLGAIKVASVLIECGCKEFFVATAHEGKILRQEFGEIIVYVLEGVLADTIDLLVEYNLTPVLNTPNQCVMWLDTDRPAAIHADSGMERLGLNIDELSDVINDFALDIRLIVSHLARADEPDHPFNHTQLERFRLICEKIRTKYPKIETSLGNSAGLIKQALNDSLSRAGIALYGGNPFSDRSNPMQQVVSMRAQVLQLRKIPRGTRVGYGGTFEARRDSVLATIGAGYADGIPRALSNKGKVYASGNYCPIVGRVSMDTLHIDVTGLSIEEGDWVELIGSNIRLDELALLSGTIAYEILIGLGKRCVTVYSD